MPTIGEAQASVAGLEKLGEFISERLSDPARLSRYPRTAMALLGEQWLREANLWRGTVRKVAEDNDEPSWSELFARWRATVEQLRLQEAEAEVLSANEAILLLIITPGGEETWVLHDRERRLAAQTEGPSEPSAALETVSRLREALKADPPVHAVSVAMPQGPLGHAPTSEWLPEYHLVPDAAVMLDRSDPGLHWRGTHGRG